MCIRDSNNCDPTHCTPNMQCSCDRQPDRRTDRQMDGCRTRSDGQPRSGIRHRTLYLHVLILFNNCSHNSVLRTVNIVSHNPARSCSDNIPSLPPDNHHKSDETSSCLDHIMCGRNGRDAERWRWQSAMAINYVRDRVESDVYECLFLVTGALQMRS